MSEEYKPKNDLPDLYNFLGLTIDVCKEPNCDELIQKAYVRKAKACHPDKHPNRKDVEEVFLLLTQSYDILKNEKQRNNYNHKLNLNKQSSNDFLKLKKSTQAYVESIGQYKPPTEQQELSFKEQMKMLDMKHGYDSSIEKTPIDQRDAKKKVSELSNIRAQQEIDTKPEKLFDEGRFDSKKFNAAFDIAHKRDEAIIAHNGVPSAWNDLGSVVNYSSFDNLDNLYVNDSNRLDTMKQNYSGTNFGTQTRKMSRDEVNNLKGADYVDSHDVLDDNYYADMKKKLADRNMETGSFGGMKYNDFSRDDTAGYGIFDQLGFKFDNQLSLDIDEDDLSKKFEKLRADHQKDLLTVQPQPSQTDALVKSEVMPTKPSKKSKNPSSNWR